MNSPSPPSLLGLRLRDRLAGPGQPLAELGYQSNYTWRIAAGLNAYTGQVTYFQARVLDVTRMIRFYHALRRLIQRRRSGRSRITGPSITIRMSWPRCNPRRFRLAATFPPPGQPAPFAHPQPPGCRSACCFSPPTPPGPTPTEETSGGCYARTCFISIATQTIGQTQTTRLGFPGSVPARLTGLAPVCRFERPRPALSGSFPGGYAQGRSSVIR